MHFFYMDESGDTGNDLTNEEQPVFVLGGISLRDEGWNKTHETWQKAISEYFDGNIPEDFELHSNELLSPNGEGPFEGHEIEKRLGLAKKAIDIIVERKHGVHYIAFDKGRINNNQCEAELSYDGKSPFLLGFDYLITCINEIVKSELGTSARGMIVFDQKDEHVGAVENIFHERRFLCAKAHRVKWIVEFASAVDSKKNPMIQLSDLVILCIRRFLEMEEGYKAPSEIVKKFYAESYNTIYNRLKKKAIVERGGNGYGKLNDYLKTVQSKHKHGWKKRYGVEG
ncbi:DUF3800 domain-containing protein [Vibrio tetraodonis]|uniref:DUF3800 domain-containing protein n=1 Tax=Vibrio tetraodonis TaxID=2231647 RepID=UPI0027E38D55|nr:DUF3800 domain-containing protein [Vibrio tetraodonis]